MISSPARRRAMLVLLALVIVACLGTVAVVFVTRSAGDGVDDRLQSLRDDGLPSDAVRDREAVLALAREFATRFNTYDESMLDEEGHLPDYAAVEELMTPKFGGVFADNVGYAEETVAQLGAASVGTVYAVGVASQDDDSAEVLVAGTIELSYPYDDNKGRGGNTNGDDQDGAEDPRVSTGPQRFRYQVSLVKIEGEWLVDDLDDIDDGLPPFSQPGIPEDPAATPSTPAPSGQPSEQPTEQPSGQPTEEGER